MKKSILIFLVVFAISQHCLSQDVITLRSGEMIRSKILEIGLTDIKYKKFDNQSGPQYIVVKSDVSNILYENGTKDVFNAEPVKTVQAKQSLSADSVVAVSNVKPASGKSAKSRFLIGFSGVWPTGIWPATALSNMGTTSFLKGQGNTLKSYGFGVFMQGNISKHFSLFFDVNTYDYNIFLGKKGQVIQTAWTVAEGGQHSSQLNVVLPETMNFDMQATGFRLGGKYIIGNNKIRPWIGAAFGYYKWTANYFNADKNKTYGKDEGYVTGMTYLLGVDLEIITGVVITPFVDLASPVATYKMKDLIYKQWDIENDSHIMGTNRIGMTISFSPTGPKKK